MASANYRFTEEIDSSPVVWPDRVNRIFETYKAVSKELSKATGRKIRIDYIPETEDYLERIWEEMARKRPDSVRKSVNSIYRVRKAKDEEYYYYVGHKTCKNALDNLEVFSYEHFGYSRRPVVKLVQDVNTGNHEPKVTAYEQCYELKWDKNQVRKLLDSSYIPCEAFYVGKCGPTSNEPIEQHRYMIRNKEDFLNGKWEDLYDLGRLGISYEHESLNLVEAARKQERQNREKAVGIGVNDSKVYG
jgi:hypothetical protein